MSGRKCVQCRRPLESSKNAHAQYCSTRCRVISHRKKHGIPAAMQASSRWVNHDPAKRPLNPHTGCLASVTKPTDWGTLKQAKKTGLPLGYVLGRGVACIDLDHCIRLDGTLTPAAQLLVAQYPENWIEYSPSGDGLHIWGTAEEQPGFKKIWRGQSIEFYARDRYITVTGRLYQAGTLAPL